jgi:acetyl-CoA carboxylase biotin carboxyl carrier protein
MTIEEIKEILQLFSESGVAELEVQRGENRVRVRRAATVQEVVVPTGQQTILAPMGAPMIPPAIPVSPPGTNSSGSAAAPAAALDNQILVKSPIVGTFYESPAPGSAPFIRVGDHVEPGQVLCIIESMKLMNEIEAEVSGMVTAKLVENGRPVEYGEALFSIRPR